MTIRFALILLSLCAVSCAGIDYRECTGPLEPGRHACKLVHDGLDRGVVIYRPTQSGPRPLVVSLHGRKGNPNHAFDIPRLEQKADAEGFVVAAPAGFEESWNGGGCCGSAHEAGIDDVGFIEAMLDEVQRLTSIDTQRVYVTGFSNGARLTHRVGCALAQRVAAIAPVAGPLANIDQDTGATLFECQPSRPLPMITIHGSADTCTPFDGGDGMDTKMNRAFLDVARERANANACQTETEEVIGATTCTLFTDCERDAAVTACLIDGGGHIWPGGDRYRLWRVCGGDWIDDFSFTDRMWRFFSDHQLPDPR